MTTTTDNTPPVKIAQVTPPRVTIQCDTCGGHCRVYRTAPTLKVGGFKYCPLCGSNSIRVYSSATTDHWESLARDYELPIPVLKELYALWQPHTGQRFGDFVHAMRQEAKADAEQANTA